MAGKKSISLDFVRGNHVLETKEAVASQRPEKNDLICSNYNISINCQEIEFQQMKVVSKVNKMDYIILVGY